MDIAFVNDNIMQVDGEVLQAKECSPDEFSRILKVGRRAIVAAISEMFEKYSAREAESVHVQRGSVLAMRLGARTLDVMEKEYYYKKYTGIDYSRQGLKPKYKEYFDVVRYPNSLIPEVRDTAGQLKAASGVALFVRDVPPLTSEGVFTDAYIRGRRQDYPFDL